MIKYASSSSKWIYVNASYPTQVYSNGQSAGQTRYNTGTQSLEVYDGSIWHNITTSLSISTSSQFDSAIEWCIKKMAEEQAWAKASEKNQAMKIAYDNYQKAKEQLILTEILVREENKVS